ncbi:MAG: GIY-YIG nuclease family protein [Candidatus Hodarchaeales archaeon]
MAGKWWSVDEHKWSIPREKQKGSYMILIHLDNPIRIFKPFTAKLGSGFYLYCGNAGKGLYQRVSRYFKRNSSTWWHIDQVTSAGKVECIFWSEILTECDFSNLLRSLTIVEPVKRFGSSDCKKCNSHFFYLGKKMKEKTIGFLIKHLQMIDLSTGTVL